MVFLKKTTVLVRVYSQGFQETILLMVGVNTSMRVEVQGRFFKNHTIIHHLGFAKSHDADGNSSKHILPNGGEFHGDLPL